MKWFNLKAKRGQNAMDYIIILALVAVFAIGVMSLFGQNVRELFSTSVGAGGEAEHAPSSNGPAGTHPAEP
jgi:pilus assembly protein Flp/PilA